VYLKLCKNVNLPHMIITITILLFSHIHVRHIEPNWTCSRARFTLVANWTVNEFAVHWTGQVKITTFPNQTEPNRTGTGQNHALNVISVWFWMFAAKFDDVSSAGKLFHVGVAATGNARSPTVDSCIAGTSNGEVDDDRRNKNGRLFYDSQCVCRMNFVHYVLLFL